MHVYVIEGKDRIKIGFSHSPESRVADIQPNVADDIKLAYKTDNLTNFKLIERLTHKLLKPHRTKGEWFKVTALEGINAIAKAIEIANQQKEDEYLTTKSYRYDKVNVSLLGENSKLLRTLREDCEKRYGKRISLADVVLIALTKLEANFELDVDAKSPHTHT